MQRPSRSAFILCGLLLAVGCVDRGGSEALVERRQFDQVFDFLSEVELQTAADDPLGRARDLVVWRDRIAIADEYGKNVKVFDREGTLLLTIGQGGQGPNEFQAPHSLAVIAGDSLAVLDRVQRKIKVFDYHGRLGRELRVPATLVGSLEWIDSRGLLAISGQLLSGDRLAGSSLSFHVIGPDGTPIRSLGKRPTATSPWEASSQTLRYAVNDDRVYWGLMSEPLLYVEELDGGVTDTVHLGEISVPPWENAPDDPTQFREWALENWTAMLRVLSTEDRVIVLFSGGDSRSDEDYRTYVIVDEDLDHQVVVDSPDRVEFLEISSGQALAVQTDDSGDSVLRSYRIE